MPSPRYRLKLGARMVAFSALTVRLSARQEALMFIVLAYHAADGTTRYLPDLRRCQLPLTAESIRAAATPSLPEAPRFSVELDCLAGCMALALKPSLPPGTEQHDWHPYYVTVW